MAPSVVSAPEEIAEEEEEEEEEAEEEEHEVFEDSFDNDYLFIYSISLFRHHKYMHNK